MLQFTFPPTGYEASLFSTSLPTLVVSCLFDNSHSKRCELKAHCAFPDLISDIEHLFIYLLAICMAALEKYLFISSPHFLIEFLKEELSGLTKTLLSPRRNSNS